MKKIWQLKLQSYNKVIAHNTFAIRALTATVEIIDWTIEEMKDIDGRTRKQLTMTGNSHPNEDVDRLYLSRLQAGRGLKIVAWMVESRVIAVAITSMLQRRTSNTMHY